MSVRGFYTDHEGDEFAIDFSYEEEKAAFETAAKKLKSFVPTLHNCRYAMAGSLSGAPCPGDERTILGVPGALLSTDSDGHIFLSYKCPPDEKPLLTTLQAEQTSRHSSKLRKIIGVHVCNVHNRSNWNLCLYTNFKWENDQWTKR